MNTRALNKWGKGVIEKAMLNIGAYRTVAGRKRRIDSSGKLRGSLKYELGLIAERMFFNFYSTEEYAMAVHEGRKPGKMPPTKPLMEWMRQKPLKLRNPKTGAFESPTERRKQNAAFGIAVNIKKFGIKPTYFFSDAVETELDKMDPAMREFFEEQIDIAITKGSTPIITTHF